MSASSASTPPTAAGAQPWGQSSVSMSETGDARIHRGRPDWTDLLFFACLALCAGVLLYRFPASMDVYEKMILVGTVPFLAWLGWLWRPLRSLMIACFLAAGFAIYLYQGDLARAEQVFFLKYLFSSQTAILWMCALFLIAMVCYWVGFVSATAA